MTDLALASLLAGWIATLFLLERLFQADPGTRIWGRRILRNILLGLIALAAAPLALATTGRLAEDIGPLVSLAALGATGALLVQFLILDIWTYGMHRAFHEIPFLWRFHAPHHLDEHLDTSSAFRFHLGEIIISATMRLIPALSFGIDVATLLMFETVLTANAVFHHSNLRLPGWFERPLSWVLVTPAIHWRHHRNIKADTDSNYTAILSVWDRLFGSANAKPRRIGMQIGVEGERDRSFARLLRYPFE
jgi:sterol desaturase/sphingolipid hydroxylase (fatty acid hydroxylase superfamily)